MTKEEFAKKITTLKFKKVTSANGARGYLTTITLENGKPFDVACYAAPDMKSKRALDFAWERLMRTLAKRFGYNGDISGLR